MNKSLKTSLRSLAIVAGGIAVVVAGFALLDHIHVVQDRHRIAAEFSRLSVPSDFKASGMRWTRPIECEFKNHVYGEYRYEYPGSNTQAYQQISAGLRQAGYAVTDPSGGGLTPDNSALRANNGQFYAVLSRYGFQQADDTSRSMLFTLTRGKPC